MSAIKHIVSFLGVVALCVTLVAAGLAACVLPPVTQGLSEAFAQDDISPFDRGQLVRVAQAARDFSFGANDEVALYQTVYGINDEYRQRALDSGVSLSAGFPNLDEVTSTTDVDQLRSAFARASQEYCLSPDAVAHLDDCHEVYSAAVPWLVVAAVLAICCLVYTGRLFGRQAVGRLLLASGCVVVLAFVAMGFWALVDFDGLFTTFHRVLFSQGNWQFPYDSLLICALPTEFWMGMGAVWLACSFFAAVLCAIVGLLLRRSSS